MVWFGLYLGITAFFEIVGPHALVFPHFILDIGWGTERAQGPFLEPTVNGVALFVCAVSSAIALGAWTAPRSGPWPAPPSCSAPWACSSP